MDSATMGIEHPNDLLINNKGVLLLDLYMAELAVTLKDYILECPEDLYIKDSGERLLNTSIQKYILDTQYQPPVLVELVDYKDLIENPTNVYKKNGEILLTYDMLTRYSHRLTSKPDISINIILLVEAYLLRTMSELCSESRFSNIRPIDDFIIEGSHEHVLAVIEDVCSVGVSEIYNFIGDDKYHIYFKKRTGTMLLIEKTIDWRIYDWHCKNGNHTE